MRLSRILLLAAVLAPAALFVIERLVVTDREAIEARIEEAAGAVANRDFVAFRDTLDEEFQGEGRDRDETAKYVEQMVQRHAPTQVRVAVRAIDVQGDTATARAVVRARPYYGVQIGVEMTLRKGPTGWRILSAQRSSALEDDVR